LLYIPAMSKRGHTSHRHSQGNERHRHEQGVRPDWIFGAHAVEAALTHGRREVFEVMLAGTPGEVKDFQQRYPLVRVRTVGKGELDKLFAGEVHQGMAARVGALPELTLNELMESNPQLIVALDQVTDPHNLGAILRSCAAFKVDAVLITEHRSAHANATVAKAAAGALETVPLVNVGNLAQALMKITDNSSMQVVGLAGEATHDIASVKPGPVCLVMGSEGEGLRRLTRERCDMLVKIPMTGEMESLNVSVATGVSLYALSRR
jgi:23S rRNA (guanosine2251-2'-O)-methyltransferase